MITSFRSPKSTLFLILLMFPILFMIGCGDSEDGEDDFSLNGTIIAMSDIAGDWNATRGVFVKNATGPEVSIDVVGEGGTITLNIQTTGRFTITVTPLGEPADVTTGQMGFDEDLLVISFDSDPDEFEFFGITHNEPVLTIAGGNGAAEYDFDGDGLDEEAFVDFIFERI